MFDYGNWDVRARFTYGVQGMAYGSEFSGDASALPWGAAPKLTTKISPQASPLGFKITQKISRET